MLGGLPTGRVGSPLYCRLRYFDPAGKRAGIPEDTAALVEKLTADSVTVTLVNTDPVVPKDVVIQGGAYAEHDIVSVTEDGGTKTSIGGSAFSVRLDPGCGAKLVIEMKRYANQPTLAFPWDKAL